MGVACIVAISHRSHIDRARDREHAEAPIYKRSFILALGIAGTGHTHNQPEENLNVVAVAAPTTL